jgi:hypothetical protein
LSEEEIVAKVENVIPTTKQLFKGEADLKQSLGVPSAANVEIGDPASSHKADRARDPPYLR